MNKLSLVNAHHPFIETATFLLSLVSQQEGRMVRWDAAREEIV